jgi:hypothetical protein
MAPRASTGGPPPANLRRLGEPRAAAVVAGAGGRPQRVEGREVDTVRESWLVEDRWWTEHPVRRRYWEIVTTCGRNVVVFHELGGGGWFVQRG